MSTDSGRESSLGVSGTRPTRVVPRPLTRFLTYRILRLHHALNAQAVAARAERWLAERADADRPWCLFLGFVAPHFPLVVPKPWFDLYPRTGFRP